MHLWRIGRAVFAGSAFTGEGSRLFGGRWNSKGTRLVYTSTSLALAAIEYFVNIDPSDAPDDLIASEAILPSTLPIEQLDPEHLDPSFLLSAELSNTLATKRIGADWIRSRRSVALQVPSLAVEGDWNILLNPEHSDFPKIQLLPDRPWHFDQRMFRRSR